VRNGLRWPMANVDAVMPTRLASAVPTAGSARHARPVTGLPRLSCDLQDAWMRGVAFCKQAVRLGGAGWLAKGRCARPSGCGRRRHEICLSAERMDTFHILSASRTRSPRSWAQWSVSDAGCREEPTMTDFILVIVAIGFFALCWAYAGACDRM
jgi:hypothetical protein